MSNNDDVVSLIDKEEYRDIEKQFLARADALERKPALPTAPFAEQGMEIHANRWAAKEIRKAVHLIRKSYEQKFKKKISYK